jgi:hypothetical protein
VQVVVEQRLVELRDRLEQPVTRLVGLVARSRGMSWMSNVEPWLSSL